MLPEKPLGLAENQKALLIWDVFKGHCTEKLNAFLENLNVKVITVQENTTQCFQPLDLTTNGSAKHFIRKKVIIWYTEEMKRKIEEGIPTEQIEVNFNLTGLRPIQNG